MCRHCALRFRSKNPINQAGVALGSACHSRPSFRRSWRLAHCTRDQHAAGLQRVCPGHSGFKYSLPRRWRDAGRALPGAVRPHLLLGLRAGRRARRAAGPRAPPPNAPLPAADGDGAGRISKDEKVLQRVELPDALRGGDLGGVPRLRYPLVVLLTHAEHRPQPRAPDMVALLTCVHLPDPVHSVSCRVLHQLLLTHSGLSYDLKRLYMSTDAPEDSQSDEDVTSQVLPEVRAEGQVAAQEEEDSDGRGGACRDCVVCQNAKVNRVLLPCRHTCLCNHCVQYFRQCPMCRQFIQFSFPLNPD
ncbi:cell growth regulator with RING finger domain protein 1 isoform X3 [Lampetra planeri]